MWGLLSHVPEQGRPPPVPWLYSNPSSLLQVQRANGVHGKALTTMEYGTIMWFLGFDNNGGLLILWAVTCLFKTSGGAQYLKFVWNNHGWRKAVTEFSWDTKLVGVQTLLV